MPFPVSIFNKTAGLQSGASLKERVGDIFLQVFRNFSAQSFFVENLQLCSWRKNFPRLKSLIKYFFEKFQTKMWKNCVYWRNETIYLVKSYTERKKRSLFHVSNQKIRLHFLMQFIVFAADGGLPLKKSVIFW